MVTADLTQDRGNIAVCISETAVHMRRVHSSIGFFPRMHPGVNLALIGHVCPVQLSMCNVTAARGQTLLTLSLTAQTSVLKS